MLNLKQMLANKAVSVTESTRTTALTERRADLERRRQEIASGIEQALTRGDFDALEQLHADRDRLRAVESAIESEEKHLTSRAKVARLAAEQEHLAARRASTIAELQAHGVAL